MRQYLTIDSAPYGLWELVRIASRQGTNVSAMLNMFSRPLGLEFIAVHVTDEKGKTSFLVEHDLDVSIDVVKLSIAETLGKVEAYKGLPAGSLEFDYYYVPEYKQALADTVKEAKQVADVGVGIYFSLVVIYVLWNFARYDYEK